jgi:putative glutamine amidotransferase
VSRPVLALTAYLEPARWGAWETRATLLHERYVSMVRAVGARAVLLPPDDDPDVSVLDRVDGLVLTGGADVDPARYGAPPHETTDAPRTDRDVSEALLYAGARERGLPVLGICRGLQVMAVASGGALHQHLPDLVGDTRHRPGPGQFVDHGATFAPGSLVARILGTTAMTVNSSHHQSVADPGTLTVTGWADDGTVEACEDPAAPFVLGVQWHPEYTDDARLLAALAAVAAGRPLPATAG